MNIPKVSVIVPVYNAKKYLEKCLDGLLNQTLYDIEIICVNDGSTDSSGEILRDYSIKDPRIRVINQKNAGAGAARNKGLSMSRGEYIGFVDSDDIVDPKMFQVLYLKAEKDYSDLVLNGQVNILDGKPHYFVDGTTMFLMEEKPFTAKDYPVILNSCFVWNRLYRRAFLEKYGLKIPENRKFAEDLLFCAQTSVCASSISLISHPYYTYNIHAGSLTDTLNRSKDKSDYLVAIFETRKFLCETGDYEIYQKDFLTFIMNIAFPLLRQLKSKGASKKFLNQLCGILDQSDIDIIGKCGYAVIYPREYQALASGCRKNSET